MKLYSSWYCTMSVPVTPSPVVPVAVSSSTGSPCQSWMESEDPGIQALPVSSAEPSKQVLRTVPAAIAATWVASAGPALSRVLGENGFRFPARAAYKSYQSYHVFKSEYRKACSHLFGGCWKINSKCFLFRKVVLK